MVKSTANGIVKGSVKGLVKCTARPRTARTIPVAGMARLLVALAVGGSPLHAQQATENALQLARAGESDRAELACEHILSSPKSTPEDRAAVEFVRGEISLTRALQETDSARAEDLLDESLGQLQRFVKRHASHALAPEARRGIDWRRHKKAERAAAFARAERDLKVLPEREKRAGDLYASLEIHYQGRIREFRKTSRPQAAGSANLQNEPQNEWVDLHLDLPRALLEHARLGGTEEDRRRALLSEAIAGLKSLQLDHCDSTVAYEACWLEGQCHAEQGDVQRARDRFRNAAALRARLKEAGAEATEECLRIIRRGQVSLVDLLLKAGQPREALEAAERALADGEEEGKTDEAILAIKLLVADCRFQLEEFPAALEMAALVAQADPEGRIGALAREKSKIWSADSRVQGSQSAPERNLSSAESQMEKEAWSAALALLRQAVEGCGSLPEPSSPERERLETAARFKMGQCLFRLGRNHESAFAYDGLLRAFPEHELAPRAAFEAARSLGAEAASTGDPKDEALQKALVDRLVARWPDHPATLNLPFLQAERAEKARDFEKAAAEYLTVKAGAEAFETARVAAARCLYQEGGARWERAPWEKGGISDAAREEAAGRLRKAEEILREFLAAAAAVSSNGSGASPRPARAAGGTEAARQKEQLLYQGTQQLSLILSHEALGRGEESLKLLEDYARTLARDHSRLARIWALQARAHLSLRQVDEAARVVDALLDRFPESPSVAQAARSVAIQLQRAAGDLAAKKEEAERVAGYSRKLHRYYLRWLNDSMARGQRVGAAEAIAVAEALFDAARRINGIAEEAPSFLDARESAPREPQPFRDAAGVLLLLADGKMGALKEKERLGILIRLARTGGFIAAETKDWQKVRVHYAAAIDAAKVMGPGGKLELQPLQANPALLSVAIELGGVLLELGRRGQKPQIDEALNIFGAVLGITAADSEPWWIAKHLQVTALYERGRGADVQLARTILDNLEKNYPEYDADRFRIKPRILALKAKLLKLTG